MKVLVPGKVYLMNSSIEVSAILEDFIANSAQLSRYKYTPEKLLAVCPAFTKDLAQLSPTLKGNAMPCVVVANEGGMEFADSHTFDFVSLDMFNHQGLYEFNIELTPIDMHPSEPKVRKYQVMAGSPMEAHLKIGQCYHRDNAYVVKVLSWIIVK